uniref:Inositol polyphosphate-related phosphatase domain-containing protein n=2 Tax=Hanusia phi TaxID=3032 RepID=A0A7S0E3I7_9CRYP|mmetsp:Transcript_15931/g.36407  ORF Transcript_15931/g.36407 Transcript_15931/m.36407 type:complete len:454 (+) Transcript_15931:538-1899(+)
MLEESKKKQLAMLAEPVAPPLLLPPKILDVDDKVQPEREILEELEAQKGVERKVTAEKLMKEMKIAGREYEEALNSRPPAKKADDEPEQEGEAGQAKEEKEGEKVGQGQNQASPHKSCSLSVFVGTWNLGGGSCPNMSLASWLAPDQFDIYAIGAQELEGRPGLSTASERPRWEAAMRSHMGKGYELIGKHCLGTTHLMCFIRSDLLPHVSDVHHAHVITGFGRVVANKAGIGICFDVLSTSFLFVTAHFAAGTKKAAVKARNEDFFRIDSGLVPLMCPIVAHRLNELKDSSNSRTGRWSVSSLFDRVFWLGDFNYRVQTTYEDALAKIAQGKRAALLLNDELLEERENNRVFPSFQEASISFDPTYKFETWTDNYDSVKKRVPSWTDRILFRTAPGQEGSIEVKAYAAASSILASDHKPIFAHFEVATKRDASTAGESRGATTSGSAACVIL